MAKLSIIKMYNGCYDYTGSCLRIPADDVAQNEFGSKWLEKYIFDMFETLYSYSSGVGLASNQVGMLKKVCVMDLKRDGKKPMVLINPKYKSIDNEYVDSNEVCLSFPDVSCVVKRYKKIVVTYKDFYGESHTIDAEGFKANVLQHEIDHLNGIVHIDLVDGKVEKSISYREKLAFKAIESFSKR